MFSLGFYVVVLLAKFLCGKIIRKPHSMFIPAYR